MNAVEKVGSSVCFCFFLWCVQTQVHREPGKLDLAPIMPNLTKQMVCVSKASIPIPQVNKRGKFKTKQWNVHSQASNPLSISYNNARLKCSTANRVPNFPHQVLSPPPEYHPFKPA